MGIQAEGSAACYNAWKAGTEKIMPVSATTIADSISADMPRDGVRAVRAVRETNGAYLTVGDDEILAAIRDLARSEAVFAEPAAAAAYAGLVKAVRQGLVKPDETIVCLITGSGLKDIKSAMQVAGEGTHIEPTHRGSSTIEIQINQDKGVYQWQSWVPLLKKCFIPKKSRLRFASARWR